MDRISRHLDQLPIPVLLFAGVAAIVFAILFPKKYGLELALIAAAAWLNLNRFTRLEPIASITKVSFFLPLLAVIYFALTRPAAKGKVPWPAWLYLLIPAVGCLCVARAADAMLGFVQFANMFLTAAAAIAVYRVIDCERTLVRVMGSVFLGLLVPLVVSMAALVFFRSQSFIPGLGRFAPFGMIPNQLVPILAALVGVAACGLLVYKSNVLRLVCMAAIGASATLLLATGSRQAVVVTLVAILPALVFSIRRPMIIVAACVVATAVGVKMFTYTEGVAVTERLTDFSDTSGRVEVAMQYFDVIGERPVAGLLGTSGLSILRDESASHITHNSYLAMLYVGGLLLGIPMLIAMAATLYSMVSVLSDTSRFAIAPIILWSLSGLLLAVYAHGLISDMAYWSVSSWTFLHYLLSCFFMGLANEARVYQVAMWRQPRLA